MTVCIGNQNRDREISYSITVPNVDLSVQNQFVPRTHTEYNEQFGSYQ